MVNWLIQSNLLDYRQITQVCDAVRSAGGNVVEATVIPFQDDIGNPEVLEGLSGIVVPYGSTKLTKIAMAKGWKVRSSIHTYSEPMHGTPYTANIFSTKIRS